MNKALLIVLLSGFLAGATGCAYGHSLRVGKSKVLVLKNDGILFGLLRKAHICDVTPTGLKNCSEEENP
jgi:hypothetical protein